MTNSKSTPSHYALALESLTSYSDVCDALARAAYPPLYRASDFDQVHAGAAPRDVVRALAPGFNPGHPFFVLNGLGKAQSYPHLAAYFDDFTTEAALIADALIERVLFDEREEAEEAPAAAIVARGDTLAELIAEVGRARLVGACAGDELLYIAEGEGGGFYLIDQSI